MWRQTMPVKTFPMYDNIDHVLINVEASEPKYLPYV